MKKLTSDQLISLINKKEFFKVVSENINNALGTNIHSLQSRQKVDFFGMMNKALFGNIEKCEMDRKIIINNTEYQTHEIARKLFTHLMNELVTYGLVRKAKEQGKGSPVVYHDCFFLTEKGLKVARDIRLNYKS